MAGELAYFIPQHGRAKISLRVPESHSLYICPPACGRRIGLRSIKNGEAEHISFLFLKEIDVVSGRYFGMITGAVAELLEILDPAPKAFLIYVNCIDDFLGTDEAALLKKLRSAFPAQRFVVCHINPVASDDNIPPGAAMQDRLYSLLDRTGKKENSVNLIGNFVLPDENGELYKLLGHWGIEKVQHLPNIQTFEEFQSMAGARLNLVMMEMGRYAAKNMEKRLGIPWLDAPVSYSIKDVDQKYTQIAAALSGEKNIWGSYRENALEKIEQCKKEVKDTPLIVDSSAASRPFALAKALVEYGFNVGAVFITHGKDFDKAERLWLEANHPDMKIIKAGKYDEKRWNIPEESIAIGYDIAFSTGRNNFVDLQRDETLFGFHGICTLMEMILEVYKSN